MTNTETQPLVRIANSIENLVKEIRDFHFPEPKPEQKLINGEMQAFALGITKGFAKSLREALDGEHDAFTRANKLRDVLDTAENLIASLQKKVYAAQKEAKDARGNS